MDMERIYSDDTYVTQLIEERKTILLERKKKAKRDSLKLFFVFIGIGMLIGVLLGAVMASFDKGNGVDRSIGAVFFQVYGSMILFFLAYYAHIIIHEAGHLVFGLLSGYEFLSFRIGSFMVIKKDGKIQKKKFRIPGTAGQCLMRLPKKDEAGNFSYVLYNFGGVIMNFLIALLALLSALSMNPSLIQDILLYVAAGGAVCGLVNGIPLKSQVNNDAMNVKAMRKDPIAKQAFYIQLELNQKCSDGVRFKDFTEAYFSLPKDANLKELLIGYQKLLAYLYYLECYNFEKANECITALEEVLEESVAYIKSNVEAERMFLLMLSKAPGNLVNCYHESFAKGWKKAKTDLSMIRIEYTYQLLYLHDKEKANDLYEKAQKLTRIHPVEGEAILHIELMDYVRELSAK